MKNHQIRQALLSEPEPRKGATFNMLMIAGDGELARDSTLTGTDHAVMRYLVFIVDHEGIAVATHDHIRAFTGRSLSGISTAIRKHIAAGRIERVGRSGFRIRGHVLTPQSWGSR